MTLQRKLYLLAGTIAAAVLIMAGSFFAGTAYLGGVRTTALRSIEQTNALFHLALSHERYLSARAAGGEGTALASAHQALVERRARLEHLVRSEEAAPSQVEEPARAALLRVLATPPEQGEAFSRVLHAALEGVEHQPREIISRGGNALRLGRVLALAVLLGAMGLLLAAIWATLVPLSRHLRGILEGVRRLAEGGRETKLDLALSGELGQIVVAVNEMAGELKQTQAQLAAAGRLASVGELAAGVAHEVNNPLSFVLSNLLFLREELSGGSPLEPRLQDELLEALEDALEGVQRVASIVQDLKAFARPSEVAEGPVDLTQVLRTTVRMAGAQLRHRSRLVEEYGDVPLIEGHAGRLGQVFLNLLLNAVQAMPPGRVADNTITLRTRLEGSSEILIEVADTGAGIAPEVLPHIFEPFFTTRPEGEGTGLGLPVCQGIVKALGGSITFTSKVGEGTTVRVTLPVPPQEVEAPLPRAAAGALAEAPAVPSGRVLVIDDEPNVGTVIRRALGPGCDVTCLTNPRHALEVLSGSVPFDVIFCDVMMPEMTGPELYAETARRVPARAGRFVFITGGVFTPEAEAFLRAPPGPLLHKPFDSSALRAAMGRVAERAGG